MMVVGVAQLKAKLSEYLARVRGGEEVVVTDHGRAVARIVATDDAGERLAELERKGLVRVGSMRPPRGFLDAPRPKLTGPDLTEALIDERRTGR
jgi:prevent-host-death family protein